MLKTKIKISQINNLTDARYFSAWGVDYLGFDINPDSTHFITPPKVKEISDWIEGPKLILEAPLVVDELWIENYRQSIGSLNIENPSPHSEHLSQIVSDDKGFPDIVTFNSTKPWSSVSISYIESLIRSHDEVFVDIPFGISDINLILQSGVAGLVIRGGDEEKVGFKSFDDLDDIFDYLSE